MNLDSPWKIVALVGVLLLLRLVWGVWKQAPSRKAMLELIDSGLIAFTLVFLLIRPFVVQAFYIPSGSMTPTLLVGDRILVNKFVYRLNPPQRGDIVVFDAPPYALQRGQTQADFVKRLIGLPGDEVQVRAGEGVFVNGQKLTDAPGVPVADYDWPLDDRGVAAGQPLRVPPGQYLVLGDNRVNAWSYDSHLWRDPKTGEQRPWLAQSRLLGKAMVTFWPPRRIGLLSDRAQVHIASDLHEQGLAHAAR